MAGLGLFHGIHRQGANRVDTELVEFGVNHGGFSLPE
jgi:hypothetical protein